MKAKTGSIPMRIPSSMCPESQEHLAPILNTLVGHIWGYYAALAINNGSRFLYAFRDELKNTIDEYSAAGLNVYEIILEQPFREKIAEFYAEFRKKRAAGKFPGRHRIGRRLRSHAAVSSICPAGCR